MKKITINWIAECASEWFESLNLFKNIKRIRGIRNNYTPMVKVSVDSEKNVPNGK